MSTPATTTGKPARTRPGQPGHVPQKRVLDTPLRTQTHLFGTRGPEATVCVHSQLGYHMGMAADRHLWSHQEASIGWLAVGHPDRLRTVSTWPSEIAAREALCESLSFADWLAISFVRVEADVATSPPVERWAHDPVPVRSCSVEACHAATALFKPLSCHRLASNMIRR